MSTRIYRLWAPIYDALFARPSDQPRRRALAMLGLQPGQRLLLPGVGTGLDLAYLPPGTIATGGDLSPAMLARAHPKAEQRQVSLAVMDAQALPFADATFDALAFNLILSVVPDGALALREGTRVLKHGGRIAIFDKFLPEGQRLSPLRRQVGQLIACLGTDPNRRLSDMLDGIEGLQVMANEPSLLGGQYRIVLLHKTEREMQ